jgi:hypothetical protein
MATRRRPRVAQRRAGAGAEQAPRTRAARRTQLLSKYRALWARYDDLVRRFNALVSDSIAATSVGLCAFHGPQPLALVQDGLVVRRNEAWNGLSSRSHGPWCRTRSGAVEAFPDLAAAAAALAEEARGSSSGVLLEAGDIAVELRATAGPSRAAVAVLAVDVSDRAAGRRELGATRAALARTAHLRALGDVAASLAPVLQDGLAEIERHARALEAAPVLTSRQRSDVRAIARGLREALEHVRRLARVSPDEDDSPAAPASLAAAVHDAIELIRPGLGGAVELDVDVSSELAPVAAAPGILTRALVHILLECRGVVAGAGAVTLRARRGGAWVVLEISADPPHGRKAGASPGALPGVAAEELVARVGGFLATGSAPHGRIAITLTLPVGDREQAPPGRPEPG